MSVVAGALPKKTHFPHASPGTHDKELRARIADFVRRAYRQRFFISREGSFSTRFFFFQAEDGIRDPLVTGVQTCALPISICSTNCLPISAPATMSSRR